MKVTAKTMEIMNTYLDEIVSNGAKISGIEKSKKGKPLSNKARF